VKRISTIGGAVLGLAILAACGGGGSSGVSAPTGSLLPGGQFTAAVVLPKAERLRSQPPRPGADSVLMRLPADPSGASMTVAFPLSGTLTAGTTVAATFSSHGDASTPPLSQARRTDGLAVRDTDGFTAIEYFELEFFAPVTLPEAPAFALTAPGTFSTAGTTYWLAFFDPAGPAPGWHDDFEGPAVLSAAPNAAGKPVTEFRFASNGRPITFQLESALLFRVDRAAGSDAAALAQTVGIARAHASA